MNTTRLVTTDVFAGIQDTLNALAVQLTTAENLLASTETSLKSLIAAEQADAQSLLDTDTNNLLGTLQDGIAAQTARLNLLHYDPSENLANMQTVRDNLGRPYCAPGNQAQSYRNHIAQDYQFAHLGMLIVNTPWKRPYYGP